jgi:2-oxoglutarate dehydrogenase E2 component (dihydrolipoamide succinyltransferase)
MPIVDLVMPKMGESIMEATILRWNKKPGEAVKQEEPVLEIATDKVDSEVPSTAEGILEEILYEENEVVPVGTIIARIRTEVGTGESADMSPVTPASTEQAAFAQAPSTVQASSTTQTASTVQASSTVQAAPIPQQAAAPHQVTTAGYGDEDEETLMQAVPYQPQPTTYLNGSAPSGVRFYSPLVLNIAASEGVGLAELETIPGSGNEGRVTKKDILYYIENKKTGKAHTHAGRNGITDQQQGASASSAQVSAASATAAQTSAAQPAAKYTPATSSAASGVPASAASTPSTASAQQEAPAAFNPSSLSHGPNVEIIEMDRMRKMIAKHMVDSKNVSAHVTSFAEADVTNMVLWRERIKKSFEHREGEKITFTPLFIDAIIRCLKRFPWLNSSVDGDRIILKKDIHMGMATALPSGNLIVPVIHNADQLNLVGLTKQVNGLAAAARNNKLKPEDTQGGTFTLTNVGSFGSIMGTPIINQPQVAILAVGVIKKRPVVVETKQGDSIAIRHIMYLSLSYDHRVIDGGLGSTFLSAVAKELENFDPNLTV